MFVNLTNKYAGTILAGLGVLLLPVPIAFRVYGKRFVKTVSTRISKSMKNFFWQVFFSEPTTMDYDDDDLDYSSHEEEEFDENKLNNDEYNLLHDTLPALKEKLKSYNDEIPEYDLKEALYYNYFEIEPPSKN